MTWLVITLMGVAAVAALWPHHYPRNHPKAGRLYRYPTFFVLATSPALFLLIAHYANVSALASIIFWVVWGIALLVVVRFAKKDGFWGTLIASVISLGIVLSPIGISYAAGSHNDASPAASASQNVGGKQAQDKASPGTGTTPASCDAKFAQKWDPNTDNRLSSAGLWDNETTHAITVSGAETRQKALIGHDVRYLASSAWSINLWDDPNNIAPLLTHDKTCLSTQGVALYDKLAKEWDSAKAEIAQAPANGVNTGSDGGTFVVNASSGITGDRTSIKRTYPNGKVGYDLARCGNHVLPGKPHGVPTGRTNTPPPKTHKPTPTPSTTTPAPPTTAPPTTAPPTTAPPTTAPPTTAPPTTAPKKKCKPGQVWNKEYKECLDTKDPGNNVPGPSGKPTAPAPTGPAETTAPVETHPADPTTQPGDEATDVPAPGASQGPTAPPTQAPATGAPSDGDKGTGIGDPDANTAAGAFALPLLGLGLFLKRRKEDEVD